MTMTRSPWHTVTRPSWPVDKIIVRRLRPRVWAVWVPMQGSPLPYQPLFHYATTGSGRDAHRLVREIMRIKDLAA